MADPADTGMAEAEDGASRGSSMMEEEQELTWRMDPEESLSDWMIEIEVDGNLHGRYHVHRTALAVGPRKSEYFARLFRTGKSFSESKTKTSIIKLEEFPAKAVPFMLDFIYLGEDDDIIKDENVAALHHVGEYFGVKSLMPPNAKVLRRRFGRGCVLDVLRAGPAFWEQTHGTICGRFVLIRNF